MEFHRWFCRNNQWGQSTWSWNRKQRCKIGYIVGPLSLNRTLFLGGGGWSQEGGQVSVFKYCVFLSNCVFISNFSDTCVLLRKQACAVKVFQFNVKLTAMICACYWSLRYMNEDARVVVCRKATSSVRLGKTCRRGCVRCIGLQKKIYK